MPRLAGTTYLSPFFRALLHEKDRAVLSACGGENVEAVIKEAFS
jgi:hypothetical protein